MISHDRLSRVLEYDPTTGIFRWKERIANCVRVGDVAGCKAKKGRMIRIDNVMYYARRLAWILTYGRNPRGKIVNLDNDYDNDRLANLAVLREEERLARRRTHPSSGHRNITLQPGGRYRVEIRRQGKEIHGSRHASLEAAIEARDAVLAALMPAQRTKKPK